MEDDAAVNMARTVMAGISHKVGHCGGVQLFAIYEGCWGLGLRLGHGVGSRLG